MFGASGRGVVLSATSFRWNRRSWVSRVILWPCERLNSLCVETGRRGGGGWKKKVSSNFQCLMAFSKEGLLNMSNNIFFCLSIFLSHTVVSLNTWLLLNPDQGWG